MLRVGPNKCARLRKITPLSASASNELSGSNCKINMMNQVICDLLDRLTNSAGTGLPFKKPCMLLH
jgi:hypothetical protein